MDAAALFYFQNQADMHTECTPTQALSTAKVPERILYSDATEEPFNRRFLKEASL